jgi:hypothetical protein
MSTVKQAAAAQASLTVTGFSTLASATYVQSSAYDATVNQPLDVIVEVTAATTNTPAGNKQIAVFAQASWDGTNYQSGPASGTTTTDEPDLTLLGFLPMGTATTTHKKGFSVAAGYGGVLPPKFKIVAKNDLGVALTSGSIGTTEISGTVV